MRILEALQDPSSQQYSASRICLVLMVFVFYPVGMFLRTRHIDILDPLNIALASIAGIYGVNSVAGAWHRLIGKEGGECNGDHGDH